MGYSIASKEKDGKPYQARSGTAGTTGLFFAGREYIPAGHLRHRTHPGISSAGEGHDLSLQVATAFGELLARSAAFLPYRQEVWCGRGPAFWVLCKWKELLARFVAYLSLTRQIVWKPPVFELVAAMCHRHIANGSFESGSSDQNKKPIRMDGLFVLELLARFELATSSLPFPSGLFFPVVACRIVRRKTRCGSKSFPFACSILP